MFTFIYVDAIIGYPEPLCQMPSNERLPSTRLEFSVKDGNFVCACWALLKVAWGNEPFCTRYSRIRKYTFGFLSSVVNRSGSIPFKPKICERDALMPAFSTASASRTLISR